MEDKYLFRGEGNLVKTEITNSIRLSENSNRALESPYLGRDQTGAIVETPIQLFKRVFASAVK